MSKTIISKKVGQDLMLYDADRDEVHVLNATAQVVYDLYREGKELDQIELEVRRRFRTEADQDIRNAIRQCIDDLKNKELIRN